MRMKFVGSLSRATLFETRAAIGTAETPAEPMSGLTFSFETRLRILAMITPAAVPTQKAHSPSARMPSVVPERNFSHASFEPTDKPSMIVTILMSAFDIVSAMRATEGPTSFARLPSISAPMSGTADGSNTAQSRSTTSGKQIFSIFFTSRSGGILISRSSFVVSAFIIGGWIIGTSAM